MGKTTNLYVHRAFLYNSFPSRHDYDEKMHNYTFWGGRELKTTTFFIFSWTSIESFKIQLQKKSTNIWRIERDRIGAKTFEVAYENIRFSSLFATGDVSRETPPAAKSEEKRMFSQATFEAARLHFLSDVFVAVACRFCLSSLGVTAVNEPVSDYTHPDDHVSPTFQKFI